MNINLRHRRWGPFDRLVTYALAVTVLIVTYLIGGCASTPMEQAAEQARATWSSRPNNCLQVAFAVKTRVPGARLYSIDTRRFGNLSHAIACNGQVCVDNGFISAHEFPLSQAREYGAITELP